MLDQVLAAFGLHEEDKVIPHGNGLINRTWLVTDKKGDFILQRVNDGIFSDPLAIAGNIESIGAYLQERYPGAIFPRPLRSLKGEPLVYIKKEGYFRIFPFIPHSATIESADNPQQAYEAARLFGEFTHSLAGLPTERLRETLPGFHDLSLRFRSFREARKKGNPRRIARSGSLISYLESASTIVTQYERILGDPAFRLRATHHDTKISNVLFDAQGKGLCVIDLDTVMPGYFISDVGDMLRTYLSPVTEEEKDFSKILIRHDYFEAVVKGYLEEMHSDLTLPEKDAFVFAGEYMMYMQSLRFLTDYLNDDAYYGRRYEDHNYIRAHNQATLLQRFREQSSLLKEIAFNACALYTT
jgi:Ser/Thr protein kinase RdoA (MazF antagonist)